MAEVALEEAAHEFLERDALGVEFRAVERDALQMFNDLREDRWFDADFVGEDVRLQFLLVGIELVDAGGEFVGCFFTAALEGVRLAVFALGILLVPVFDEDDFAELAESGDGAPASTFPKGLVAFADGGAEFFPRDGG